MLKLLGKDRNPDEELARIYGRQRVALDAYHRQHGIDVFISPFDILKNKTGVELSYSTWPDGVIAWLPRTECIAFTGKRSGAHWFLIVRWGDVEVICPKALTPVPNQSPERMLTVTWPNESQLEGLSKLAIIKK